MDGTPARSSVRTLFVSDVHLGCRFAQCDAFCDYLDRFAPEQLYLIGDFVDGWKLSRRWFWRETCSRIFERLIALAESGTRIFYAPGNHDAFLRNPNSIFQVLCRFRFLSIAQSFVHTTADCRRLLVIHGDLFDRVETGAQWLSRASSLFYDALLAGNRFWTRTIRRRGMGSRYVACNSIKWLAKRAVRSFSDYETRVREYAVSRRCQGVVFGHIHSPAISEDGGFVYANTGDWVENCTAIVEHFDGQLELHVYESMNLREIRNNETQSLILGPEKHYAS